MTRVWTLAEAQAELPALQAKLEEAQQLLHDLTQANEQVAEIESLHGGPPSVKHADHEDWLEWGWKQSAAAMGLKIMLRDFQVAGISVKSIEHGLVDFTSTVGDRQVWLCWRIGEETIQFYHEMNDGFAGRRAIPTVPSLFD